MKKIGIVFGIENSFPGAVVERINSGKHKTISAESVHVGAVAAEDLSQYNVLVDRISHVVPFYRSWLKQAALRGTVVINDPLLASAADRFYGTALAARAGMVVPPTVLLPHKQHPGKATANSLRNLEYPLDWEKVFATVGEHGFLRPVTGGGEVLEVRNREEFFAAYDSTGDQCVIYQKAIDYTAYFRCWVVGGIRVRVVPYDPRRSPAERTLSPEQAPKVSKALLKRMEAEAAQISQNLGFDLNCVDFAVTEAVPFLVDCVNPVPEVSLEILGDGNYEWLVNAVAELAVAKAQAGQDFSAELPIAETGAEAIPAEKAAQKISSPKASAAKSKTKKTTAKKEK